MTEARLNHLHCLRPGGLHRMAYWEWGDPANPHVVLCVHGLTRQGRDFDTLARDLSAECRVVCPDVLGRGQSDWLQEPTGYNVPAYVADMVSLLARVSARPIEQLDWVGTSMGGLIGLGIAALARSPVRRLVLNDVGPTVEPVALERIGRYLGQPLRFDSVEAGADAMWTVASSFGPHTPQQWLELSRPQLRAAEEGGYKPHYDPDIAVPFKSVTPEMAAMGEAALWRAWDRVTAPTLLLRGAQSDLLSPATAQQMTRRGPPTTLREIAGVGHAPTLVAADQRQLVRDFLLGA